MKIPCEQWDRVVGYYRPINQCNDGKKQEVSERKRWNLDERFFKYFEDKIDEQKISSSSDWMCGILYDK